MIDMISGLKKEPSSIAETAYNKAIDDVIEILTGERVTYPERRCFDCFNCFIFDDALYFCDARDDLGGKDGEISIEHVKTSYPCASFSSKQLLDHNKIGKSTCPECGKEGYFYWFNDVFRSVYGGNVTGMNPTTCQSCESIIFQPRKKMVFDDA